MTDEQAFLRMIVAEPDNDGAKLVYADWLEEQGDADRAAFLRLESRLAQTPVTDTNFYLLNAQFRGLHDRLDPDWLALIDRTEIENCFIKFEVPCPKRWEQLHATETDAVRFCETCRKNVYHCPTIDAARDHARDGHCVAVDSRLSREPGDLYEPSWRMDGMTMGVMISLPDRPRLSDRFMT